MQLRDLTGQRFGRLVVLAMTKRGGYTFCKCRCDCGNEKDVAARSLKDGGVKGCRCVARDRMVLMNLKHGDCIGGKPSVEWTTWRSMVQRCEDPKQRAFKDYGGRGIRVCDRWRHGDGERTGFECFLADMGRRPSADLQLDRWPDNDGNYEPGNCRWATRSQQARNRRQARRAGSTRTAA